MIEHMLRASISTDHTRWRLAGAGDGCCDARESKPNRSEIGSKMQHRCRLSHQSAPAESSKLRLRLRPAPRSGVRARHNPHRAR